MKKLMRYKELMEKLMKYFVYLLSFFVIIIILINLTIGSNSKIRQSITSFYNSGFSIKIIKYDIISLSKKILPAIKYYEILNSYKVENESLRLINTSLALEKDLVNQTVFPKTQFLELEYQEKIIKKEKILNNKLFKINNIRYGETVYPFYIEYFQEKIIIANINGQISFLDYQNLFNNNDQISISSNLPKNISITDILIINNEIYVSLRDNLEGCRSHQILKAKINFESLNFEKVYSQKNKSKEFCNQNVIAGRLAYLKEDKNNFIIFSVIRKENIKKKILDYKYCDIIKINLNSLETELISTGHRNPQGLLVNSENHIISTEHGPRGGDEINLIRGGKNYGWPIASYGENYNDVANNNEIYKFKKNHRALDYEEPTYSFVPSIGISQILELPNNFSKKWQNSYLITSLRAGEIYKVIFSNDFSRVITMEKIRTKKRIRDIIYLNEKKIILIAVENDPNSIGIISVK